MCTHLLKQMSEGKLYLLILAENNLIFIWCFISAESSSKSGASNEGGKIVFKKPQKRSSTDQTSNDPETKKIKPTHRGSKKDKYSSKKVNNTNLLSFGDDDEEESD